MHSPQGASRRILYVYPDTMGPSETAARNALHHFSGSLFGEMIPIFVPTGADATRILANTARAIGDFSLHPVYSSLRIPVLKQMIEMTKIIAAAMRLMRERGPYDAIVAHGPYRTAFAGLFLSRRWGVPLIVEFPGHPINGLRLDQSLLGRLKVWIAPRVLAIVVRRATRLRLLYPTQLDDVLPSGADRRPEKMDVFHDFVPVSLIAPSVTKEPVVLFVGFPWYLKGVDVLIAAFLRLTDSFPDVTLKIVGYCPDLAPWRQLTGNHPRIQLLGPLPNEQVATMMAESQVFVLPSRTEAMGRVLLEAMAAKAAIVASRVDGIPTYVRDEVDGLLAAPADIDDLERQLRRVLASESLRSALTDAAEDRVRTLYDEKAYVAHFSRSVTAAIESVDHR
jgi:glycosyltransferase involved in cell wall biosynthesis